MTDGCHLFQGSARCPGRATCWSVQWRCWCCASVWASARRGTSPRIRTRIPCAFDNRDTRSRFTPTPRRRRPPRSPSSRFVDHRACCVHAPCVSMRPSSPSPPPVVQVEARSEIHMYHCAYKHVVRLRGICHARAGCFCLCRGVLAWRLRVACELASHTYFTYMYFSIRDENANFCAISYRFNAWFNANAPSAWLTPSHWHISRYGRRDANVINERRARNIIHR